MFIETQLSKDSSRFGGAELADLAYSALKTLRSSGARVVGFTVVYKHSAPPELRRLVAATLR
jgi:hypothetical protein